MRRIGLVVAVALLASACAGSQDDAGRVPATLPALLDAAPEPTLTLPPPTTLAFQVAANPLTEIPLGVETLAQMPMRELGGQFAGFVAMTATEETNEATADRLPQSTDQVGDLDEFARETGFRAVLQPTRFTGSSTLSIDLWVESFATALGAAGALDDYVGDLAKGLDAAASPDLRITEVRNFAVEEVGDSARGIVLVQQDVDTGDIYYETVIAFRLGRLIAVVSMLREVDGDVRVRALGIARDFEARIISVLDGSLQPPVIQEPAVLTAYRFSYRQKLSQSFRVVEGAVAGDEPGGGDGGGEEPGEGEEPVTTTTVPIRWKTERSSTSVDTSGVVLTDGSVDCSLSYNTDGRRTRKRYIVIGEDAWVSESGRSFKSIDPDEAKYHSDLLFCPGWSPSRTESGVRGVTRPSTGDMEEWADDEMVERFDLGRSELVAIGLGGETGSGISVSRFKIWTSGDGPWVRRVELRMSGSSTAMEAAFGPGYYPGGTVTIELTFAAEDINDPTLTVEAP